LIIINKLLIVSSRQSATARQWAVSSADDWVLRCDASWCERKKMGGIGWILRKGDGTPVTAGFRNIPHQWKVSWLEALAVIEGLKSISLAPPKLIIELDSIQVVHLLEGKEEDQTELNFFAEEAQRLSSGLEVQEFRHIPRRQNKIAHFLAQKAVSTGFAISWVNDFPI
ncbi:MAG: ribonuclease H family protein, partial [Sweet potato little leaf phytoplasma]|nr:ribonuclease H family protein [Sweet potato little leaf phytoplasma]